MEIEVDTVSPPEKHAEAVKSVPLSKAPVIGVPHSAKNDTTPKHSDVLEPISFIFSVMLARHAGLDSDRYDESLNSRAEDQINLHCSDIASRGDAVETPECDDTAGR